MKRILLFLIVLSAVGLPAAGAEPAPTSQPVGLAAKYPGDAGIEKGPAVLFHDDFESAEIDKTKWTSVTTKPGVVELTNKTMDVYSGRQALKLSATMGADTGGSLFVLLPAGYEQMYARFCVKFAKDIDYIHHFVRMVANRPAVKWPQGRAGIKPAGDERFTVAIEPWGSWGKYPKPGGWHYYCYWWQMPRSKDGKFWGQGFADKPYAVPAVGKWYCVEFMVKCNTPGKPDGETAFWVDGKKLAHHKGINWRSSGKLKLNGFCLMLYITDRSAPDAKPGKVNRVWFDNVVVATKYIGPPTAAKAAPAKAAEPKRPVGTPHYRLKQRVRSLLDKAGRRKLPLD